MVKVLQYDALITFEFPLQYIYMLKETYFQLLEKHTDDKNLIREFWQEIESNYTNPNRHYHTLNHIQNLLNQLLAVKADIQEWDTILFTLFYHDLIYSATKPDNEEQSALIAEKRMRQISVQTVVIADCRKQILATKSHLECADIDTNLFTDADLSILGADWETYSIYSQNVRKEYSIYPDLVYNPGRKKLLKHFLEMTRIYKTDYFYSKLEELAKCNLLGELDTL